ncbi:MAG: hypothetical protein MUF33_15560 [Candidatus Nanopelagicales bacterium]|jgi:hypothetical protein|nr:hypothetical protein [Candidatus Nanopelagicales bacterium]MCU0299910.1 hypothetical protein [Candidatus Nanopelagicales bacterium]
MKIRTVTALGATAMLALAGFAGPATAVKPGDGLAGGGNAMIKAQPKGQAVPGWNDEKNRGFRCDYNPGVGHGNPAFMGCEEVEVGEG